VRGAFGGAWLDLEARKPVVATTDATQVGGIRAAGAEARLVARSQRDLDAAKVALDRSAAPVGMTGWYVDVRANRLIVCALPAGTAAARDWVRARGVDPALVDVVTAKSRPTVG
jgi:streptogrisin C